MQERSLDIVLGIALLALGGLLWVQLEGLPIEGRLFPSAVIVLMACGSLALIVRALCRKGERVDFFGKTPVWQWCLVTALFAAQCLVSMYVSFKLGMGLGMLVLLLIIAPKKNWRSLLGSVLCSIGFLLFFEIFFCRIMHIYFPEKLLGG